MARRPDLEKFAKEHPYLLKADNSGGAGTKGGGISPSVESQLAVLDKELKSLPHSPEHAEKRAELEAKMSTLLDEAQSG